MLRVIFHCCWGCIIYKYVPSIIVVRPATGGRCFYICRSGCCRTRLFFPLRLSLFLTQHINRLTCPLPFLSSFFVVDHCVCLRDKLRCPFDILLCHIENCCWNKRHLKLVVNGAYTEKEERQEIVFLDIRNHLLTLNNCPRIVAFDHTRTSIAPSRMKILLQSLHAALIEKYVYKKKSIT